MEKIATLTENVYGKLLAKTRTRVIATDAENERALTPEGEELAELLTVLIEKFEDAHYDLGKADPVDALRDFMEVRGLRQRDLIPMFGSSSVVSDVLNGKRSISKAHAASWRNSFTSPWVCLFKYPRRRLILLCWRRGRFSQSQIPQINPTNPGPFLSTT